MVKIKIGQNEKWKKLNVVKMKIGQNGKWSKRKVVEMMCDPKNKGTLFSSILKVEEIKVHLFALSVFILVSYSNSVVL